MGGMALDPLLYPKSKQAFSPQLFQNPSSEYRGAPFWVWNNKLQWDELQRGIDRLEQMGMGGYHIHSRTGLDTAYMGEEYLNLVKKAVQYGKQKNMKTYLYDEDRWPSGSAGGLVVKENKDHGAWHLLITTTAYTGELPNSTGRSSASPERSGLGRLVALFDIVHSENSSDHRITYRSLPLDCDPKALTPTSVKGTMWYVYLERNPPSEWFNGQTYVDTLNPEAMASFVEKTHKLYQRALGDEFGKSVPSIFTDEPQFAHKSQLHRSQDDGEDLFLPWTPAFAQSYARMYNNQDIISRLPELIWEAKDSALIRYRFHNHLCETFVKAFMDQISTWCRSNNILLTGHMMHEGNLHEQTAALGEAMRCYRNLDMPGIDILCDSREYNTAKQAQSVGRQKGVHGMMCEIYGVTDWTFTFAGHKNSGDWQACLGVTLRVHHLAPTTIAGESKRDYPAPIFYQNSWSTEYRYLEDHYARLNTVLTRGHAVTRVAIIHPIESFWCIFGPRDKSGREQKARDEAHLLLTKWLLFSLVDFDFISESLFPNQTELDDIQQGGGDFLVVGKCKYETIIVPNLKTIRSTTLERLNAFAEKGGRVVVLGSQANLVDAIPGDATISNAILVPSFGRTNVLEAIGDVIDVKAESLQGEEVDTLMYQMRDDGESRYFFACNTDKAKHKAVMLSFRGSYSVTFLDTFTGHHAVISSAVVNGWTSIEWPFSPSGHLLVRLTARERAGEQSQTMEVPSPSSSLVTRNYFDAFTDVGNVSLDSIELTEPNVLLLDYASWAINNEGKEEQWHDEEEILRVDNLARMKIGLPQKYEATAQPWSMTAEQREIKGTLHLRFRICIESDITESIELAMESLFSTTSITLDGKPVSNQRTGWWVDEHISTLLLCKDGMSKGEHVLQVNFRYGALINIERFYLLGNFAVQLFGREHELSPLKQSKLRFGDLTRQGLPFYAGDVLYHCHYRWQDVVTASTKEHAIQVWQQAGVCLVGSVDNGTPQNISLPPSVLVPPSPSSTPQGATMEHRVQFKLYSGRANAFGCVHLPPNKTHWIGPNTPRAEHDWWMNEYRLEPVGILQSPVIIETGVKVDKYVQFTGYIKYSDQPRAPF